MDLCQMRFFILDSGLDTMIKLGDICYEVLRSASTAGFDAQNSDVEARLRYILPILPKSMRTEYADSVWRSLEAAIEPGDDATVASSDNVDDIDSNIRKLIMKLIAWHVNTERVIAVLSEFVPGYRPTKRFPASCVKRRGPLTIVWWNTDVVRSYCRGFNLPHVFHRPPQRPH